MKTAPSDAEMPLFLIAEDDLDDQLLLMEALRENGIGEGNVAFVTNGDELMQALESLGNRPTIIIMDLNMPRKDGRETLLELKAHPAFNHIPVVILTTSNSEDDIRLTYQSGGNTFFIKPPVFGELVEMIGLIKVYWFERAALAVSTRAPL